MSYSADVLADSPLLYWRFEETSGTSAADSSGNSRNGTYENSPTLNQTGLLAEGGKCVDFDGTNDYVRILDAAWMDSSAFTVHCLVRTDANSSYNAVMNRDGVAGSRGWNLYILNGKLHCFDANLGGSVATGAISLSNSTTYHVAMVSTGTQVRLYVNGVLDVQVTASVSNTLANQFAVAASIAGSGNANTPAFYLNGKVDEVAFVGSALTGTRIADLYTASTSNTTTVNGGLISEATTLFAASVVAGALITGGLVAETNTVHSGTTTAGVTVSAGLISETSTVLAGSASQGSTVTGGLISEANTAHAGTKTVGTVRTGGIVSETSTVLAPSIIGGDTTVGGLISETTTVLPGSLTYSYNETDTSNAADGLVIDGFATWTWTPDVVAPPTPGGGGGSSTAGRAVDVALAFSEPTITGATPHYTVDTLSQPRLRQRVVIGGTDVSWLRGYPTVVEGYQLLEPFLYGPATVLFPQVSPFDTPGAGALAFLRKGNSVRFESVDDETGSVESVDYKGIVEDWNLTGGNWRVAIGGEVTGPASHRLKTIPLFQRRRDVGRIIWRMVRNLGVQCKPWQGADTGIILGEPGGADFLTVLSELHAKAQTRAGRQWSTMPDADGIYRTEVKDRTTVHASIYCDDARNVADLHSDLSEEPNRIFGTGTTPEGMRVNNGVYPGVRQGETPTFPGTIASGDSGDDVQVLIQRLKITRYLNADEAIGGFDADVVEAVKNLQEDAGLSETGVVNSATWDALWDLGVTGYSTRWSQIMPLAQRDYTREWNHSGGGAYTSRNDGYDPSRPVVDRHIDFGAHQRRTQMREWAKAELFDGEEQWTGTIRLTTGAVVAGDHTPGDPITSIMRAKDIKPGMNVRLPVNIGGVLLHVGGVSVSGNDVTLTVDTKARDAMAAWEVIQRNRESRHDPARSWLRQYRNSGQVKDTLGEWSEVGGLLGNAVDLAGGEWTTFQAVAGPIAGTIRSLRLNTTSGTEFAVVISAREISADRLNNNNPAPLTESGTEFWTDPEQQDWLEDRILLYQAGGFEDPCGYHPKKLSKGATIITGDFYDDAQFSYHCQPPLTSDIVGQEALNRQPEPILYFAVWASQNSRVRAGRIMWPQAEGAV